MRYLTKRISLLLALVIIVALAVPGFASTADTGSITIRSAKNVSVAGKTFNAYKILNVEAITGSGDDMHIVYTVPAEMKGFYQARYTLTGSEVDFDVKVAEKIKEETDLYAFAAAALAAAKAANPAPTGTATAGASDTAVTISDLPLGYYVVEDAGGNAAPISALILDTTTPGVTVTFKADQPTIDKTAHDSEYHNAAVGDSVPFKVTSNVPNMTGYEKYFFIVTDTLSKGLTFNDDVKIQIGNVTLNACTHADGDTHENCYTVTSTSNGDNTTIEIVFKNFIQYAKEHVGESITIEYTATLNENAVIGVEGNTNEVTLIYSNNPNTEDDGEPGDPDKPTKPTGTTPKSETRTYVTGITLKKVDSDGHPLAGAEFEISGTKTNIVLVTGEVYVQDPNGTYWLLKDGTYTTTDPSTPNVDVDEYQDITIKYSKITEKTPITTTDTVKASAFVDSSGVLKFEGLSAGDYTIQEIKAPAGYNLLNEPIHVTIGWQAPAEGETDCTWTYTWTADGETAAGENGTVTVKNQTGSELPSTGGPGTNLFYILGGILAVGAGILLVAKKRMNAKK